MPSKIKNLLSTLFDKLFNSKKEFITYQLLPNKRITITIPSSTTVTNWSYTPPSNGWISIYAKNIKNVDIYQATSSKEFVGLRMGIGDNQEIFSNNIMVNKGIPVVVNGTVPTELWFCPFNGSS